MGIDIRAKLIFGATHDDLSHLEDLNEMLDDGDLDYASPYYDSDRETWIIGIALPSNMAGEAEFIDAVRRAKLAFEELTDGAVGRIFVSPDVS